MSLKDEIVNEITKREQSKHICTKSKDDELRDLAKQLCSWIESRFKKSNIREVYKHNFKTYVATGQKVVAERFVVNIFGNYSNKNDISFGDDGYFSIYGKDYHQILLYLEQWCFRNDVLMFNDSGKTCAIISTFFDDKIYVKSKAISDTTIAITTKNDVCHGIVCGTRSGGAFYLVLKI